MHACIYVCIYIHILGIVSATTYDLALFQQHSTYLALFQPHSWHMFVKYFCVCECALGVLYPTLVADCFHQNLSDKHSNRLPGRTMRMNLSPSVSLRGFCPAHTTRMCFPEALPFVFLCFPDSWFARRGRDTQRGTQHQIYVCARRGRDAQRGTQHQIYLFCATRPRRAARKHNLI